MLALLEHLFRPDVLSAEEPNFRRFVRRETGDVPSRGMSKLP
jgi:hypothetical protein